MDERKFINVLPCFPSMVGKVGLPYLVDEALLGFFFFEKGLSLSQIQRGQGVQTPLLKNHKAKVVKIP